MSLSFQYEPPRIVDLGPIAEHTFMPTPPGCGGFTNDRECRDHKGYTNIYTPDGSDAELSSSNGGPGPR
jgi:hypothetical protein